MIRVSKPSPLARLGLAERIRRLVPRDPDDRTRPNLAHMNALIDAVESGNPGLWRRHPISHEELAAAYRATGRKPEEDRQPGEDREEAWA